MQLRQYIACTAKLALCTVRMIGTLEYVHQKCQVPKDVEFRVVKKETTQSN